MMNYMWAGQCNHVLGHYDEALNMYNLGAKAAASKKGKTDHDEKFEGDILFNRGMNYCSLGGNPNLYRALEDFEGALEKQAERENPVKHKTLFNLGIVYRKIGVQAVLHDMTDRL
jgi:tetratricopeptide (TPR) repeat protein